MAPNVENDPSGTDQKTLHVWSKPMQPSDEATTAGDDKADTRPTISNAMGMIKSDDFANVHNTPCARQGFLTGIASAAGLGGLKFVVGGMAKARLSAHASWLINV